MCRRQGHQGMSSTASCPELFPLIWQNVIFKKYLFMQNICSTFLKWDREMKKDGGGDRIEA